jgi:hypothetical protein
MGVVYLLDVSVCQEVKRFLNHTSPVLQICLDPSSEFVVTCAEDGAILFSLFSFLFLLITWQFIR